MHEGWGRLAEASDLLENDTRSLGWSGPDQGIGDFHPYALGRLRAERTGFDKMRGRGILWAGMQGIPLPLWL